MPLTVNGKKYEHFENAVRAIMRERGWSEERARRYVGEIKHRQEGKR